MDNDFDKLYDEIVQDIMKSNSSLANSSLTDDSFDEEALLDGAKKVLIMWDKEMSFFAVTIKERLEKDGLIVKIVEPTIESAGNAIWKEGYKNLLLYISEDVYKNKNFQAYIRDECIEHKRKLCLIGDAESLDKDKAILNENVVRRKFYRPIDVTAVAEGVRDMVNSNVTVSSKVKKRILIVDDSAIFLRTAKGWFETKYEVSIANSAAMAFSYLHKNAPDLILLDYEMPLCNGPQFLDMLHAELDMQDIPVIFLTGKNDNTSVMQAIKAKPEGYLLKTMEPKQILEYVDDFFDHYGTRKK